MLKQLYTPKETPMQVAVFMSGAGSVTVKLLEHQKQLEREGRKTFEISTIVTDNSQGLNNSRNIARNLAILNFVCNDFRKFHQLYLRGPMTEKESVPYFTNIIERLERIRPQIDWLVFAGYRTYVGEPLLSAYANRMVRVYQADLSIRNRDDKAAFSGENPVLHGIYHGSTQLRASTHIVTAKVHSSPVLLISEPVMIHLPSGVNAYELRHPENEELKGKVVKLHKKWLKERGDKIILPITVELISRGAFAMDEDNLIHLNFRPMPTGCKIEFLADVLRT